MHIENLRHRSPGIDQIPAELIKKGGKTDCFYRGMSLLPTTYKILSSILLSRLTPYAD